MANEGIMSLPAMGGMQGDQAPQPQAPTVTSADSYDAALTALGTQDPQAVPAVRAAVQEAIADMDLAPEQIDLLIQVFEYVSSNPTEYKNMVSQLLQQDIIDPGDLPEEYDPQFIGMVLMVLNELRSQRAQGAMEPMMQGPMVEGLEPMTMAEGGLADVASFLAAQGRKGDTMLAHITPEEAQLLKERGGSGTINPVTGLPEFFLKKLWNGVKKAVKSIGNAVKKALQSPIGRIIGTVALAAVLGPTALGMSLGTAGTAAVASGATTLLGGGSIKDALVAGAMGYIGGGGTIMGANPVSAVGSYLPGAAGGALNTGLATGVIGAGVGKLAGMSTADALKMGLSSGVTAGALKALQPGAAPGTEGAPAEGGAPQGGEAPVDKGIGSLKTAASNTGVGAPGQIGTAQDMLGGGLKAPAMGPSMSYDPMSGSFKPDYSLGGAPSAATPGMEGALGTGLRMPSSPMSGAPGMGDAMGAGLRAPVPPALTPSGAANYSLSNVPQAAQPTGFIDKMVSGAKDLYNEYLSPSRPGLAADAGILSKYGPLAAAGTAVMAATGGMKGEPANPNPAFDRNYTGLDYIRDNPDMFQGGLDFSYTRPSTPANPVVQTDFSRITAGGVAQPGVIMPTGATMSPGGVAQPYNVAGLYGVPLIYPVGRAKGGEMTMTEFPRKTGPINGPGTGTSDSIPAMLSDGEFVFTAKAVRNAGGGSRRKGAARMYKLMKKLEGGPVKG